MKKTPVITMLVCLLTCNITYGCLYQKTEDIGDDIVVSDNNDELENKIDNLDAKVSELITKLHNHETRKNT